MTLGQVIGLGIIQGLTEFLPISSTAHLGIIPKLLGWPNPPLAFKAVIQLGTLVAVLVYFRQDILAISKMTWAGMFGAQEGRPDGTSGTTANQFPPQLGWMIALGTIPVVAVGLALKHQIEWMNNSLTIMAGALIGLALVLALAEWLTTRRQTARELGQIGWGDALIVGLTQAVAVIPGASRSGCTIAGGLFCGLSRSTAARFSFLLSLPAIFAAGMYELYKERHELFSTAEHMHDLIIATVVAGVVGYLSIAFLLEYLKKHSTWLFIVYRLVLGAVLIGLIVSGRLAG